MKKALRIISIIMLIGAIVFLWYAFTHPVDASVFYIGNLAIGSDIWRVFYAFYAVVMVALFGVSFFVKGKK